MRPTLPKYIKYTHNHIHLSLTYICIFIYNYLSLDGEVQIAQERMVQSKQRHEELAPVGITQIQRMNDTCQKQTLQSHRAK